jgi:hypothetical protein
MVRKPGLVETKLLPQGFNYTLDHPILLLVRHPREERKIRTFSARPSSLAINSFPRFSDKLLLRVWFYSISSDNQALNFTLFTS